MGEGVQGTVVMWASAMLFLCFSLHPLTLPQVPGMQKLCQLHPGGLSQCAVMQCGMGLAVCQALVVGEGV